MKMLWDVIGEVCGTVELMRMGIDFIGQYGCYCGVNTDLSENNPTMDEIDAICKVHDHCWAEAEKMDICKGQSAPWKEGYVWSYDEKTKEVKIKLRDIHMMFKPYYIPYGSYTTIYCVTITFSFAVAVKGLPMKDHTIT